MRAGRVAVSLLAAGLLMAACSSPSAKATGSRPTTTVPASSQGSSCDRPAPAGSRTLDLRIAKRERVVIVHVSAAYNGHRRVPLVLNFHGSGSTAAGQEAFSGMDATSDADDFIVAYPQGAIVSGSGYDWNIPGVPLLGGAKVPAGAANDLHFAVSVVRAVEARYCIDPRRVYATGFSGGARLTSQLACDDSQLFAAVAPVSGLRRPTPCPTTRPVPVLSFHGKADPVDPYAGHGQAYWTYSVPTAAGDWAKQDGCHSSPDVSQLPGGVTLTRYSPCQGGATVELYSISSEGHEWPGGPRMPRALTRLLGPQTTAINADQVMWRFFSRYELAK